MKTIIILFVLSITFIPLAISGRDPHIRLPTGNSAVLDVEGNPVVVGAKYYAVPATLGVDGGISAAQPKNGNPSACPIDVVLNSSIAGYHPIAQGRPLVFYPLKIETTGGDVAAVQESHPLNVAFYAAEQSDPCAKETVWKLDVLAEQPVVVTGGTIGDEGGITNWFRIARNFRGSGYVFTFWPSLCSYCRIRNWRIGTVGDSYQLGINDDFPFPFNFVRAE